LSIGTEVTTQKFHRSYASRHAAIPEAYQPEWSVLLNKQSGFLRNDGTNNRRGSVIPPEQ